jgi:putative ABC transport system permease protein
VLRLSTVAHLYRIRLRARIVQEVLALVGIAIGVALMFSALVANSSLTGSVKQLTSGIVGQTRYQVAARGGEGFDQRALERVRALPGVRDAAPVLEARAVVVGPSGRKPVLLVGGDPRFAQIGGPLLRQFTSRDLARQEAIVMPAPIAREIGATFGREVEVITGAGLTRTFLAGQLQEPDIGSLVRSPVVLAPLAYAQKLSGLSGRVTRIFVLPRRGADTRVRAALDRLAAGRLNVRQADAEVRVFEQAALPTNQSTALFATFAALIGFLFSASAVLLTVPQRRRFIADLSMAGHPPKVVVQIMLFDALVLGTTGALAGLALGDLLSRSLFSSVPGYLAFAFPIGAQRIIDWQSVALAVTAGFLAAIVAVLAPVREIFAQRPSAQAPSAPPGYARRLLGVGATCLASAAAVLVTGPDGAVAWWGAMVALTIALLCLLPALFDLSASGLGLLGRRIQSPVPFLALTELGSRAARTRTLALGATGAIAVFASVAIGGARADLQRGLDASASDIDSNAAVWATFPGAPNSFATTSFAVDGVLARIERLPGVRAAREYHGGFLDIGQRRVWVLAPPAQAQSPIPPTQLLHGHLKPATQRIRSGGWAVLSEAVADERRVDIGDSIMLPTPVPIRLRVAAVSTNLGWPPGAVVMNPADYARAWGSSAPSALHVSLDRDADPLMVEAAVGRALGARLPLTVETKRERERRHFAASREGLSRLTQISALVLGAAVLAMATAMAGVLWQRRPMLASLKVDGLREGSLWRALLLESGFLLGTGCLAGAVFGLAGQVMLSHALEAVTGFPVFYAAGALIAVATLVLVTAVALAILAVPGWMVVRVRPATGSAD